jgi:hypothetical protein
MADAAAQWARESNVRFVHLAGEDANFSRVLTAWDQPEPGWSAYTLHVADVSGDGRADLVWNELGAANRTYPGSGRDAITTPACEYSAALYEDVECTQLILEASLGNILETIACVDKPLDKPLGCLCAGVVTESLAVCAPPRDPVPDERKPVPSDQNVYCCMPRGA